MAQITKWLPCVLNDQEIKQRGQQLAEMNYKRAQIEDEKKAANSEFKEKIDNLEMQAKTIVQEIRSKSEYRDVPVTEEKDFDVKVCRTIRTDTGEIVSERPLRVDELQRKFKDENGEDISPKGTLTLAKLEKRSQPRKNLGEPLPKSTAEPENQTEDPFAAHTTTEKVN